MAMNFLTNASEQFQKAQSPDHLSAPYRPWRLTRIGLGSKPAYSW
jgi:hypothetical protein